MTEANTTSTGMLRYKNLMRGTRAEEITVNFPISGCRRSCPGSSLKNRVVGTLIELSTTLHGGGGDGDERGRERESSAGLNINIQEKTQPNGSCGEGALKRGKREECSPYKSMSLPSTAAFNALDPKGHTLIQCGVWKERAATSRTHWSTISTTAGVPAMVSDATALENSQGDSQCSPVGLLTDEATDMISLRSASRKQTTVLPCKKEAKGQRAHQSASTLSQPAAHGNSRNTRRGAFIELSPLSFSGNASRGKVKRDDDIPTNSSCVGGRPFRPLASWSHDAAVSWGTEL